MVKQTIQIFARIKPTKSRTGLYDLDEDDDGEPRLTFTVPKDLAEGFINNKKENYKFRFQKVFDQSTKQDEIFDNVSKPVVDNVLEGYNGTIFAYGQTGSGKTFTITGGAERYTDRGIIPRTLSYLFEQFEQDAERTFSIHISYLELYNESGYDLLDPKHEAAKLEDLPKVSLMEDSDQNIHLKNLSVHTASNEEEALNLLFLGDTNRMIAETPMNQASTRSHCIFTIHLTSRESGSATIRRAKLHLVDLAGSERVSKTGSSGVLLTEAKYINLSLHFLEQVIIALAEKSRQHIPYRNSMMTSVLRDSLGGNCMTTMIATCAVEKRNVDESISTCRFAQRVALIKNDVMVNEELDPKLMILKLKREIQQLKEELAMATGEQRTDELSAEDLERCQEAVTSYLSDQDPEALLNVGADMRKIQACYRILKKQILEKPAVLNNPTPSPPRETTPPDTGPYSNSENKRLKELVMQRDNEINILVNMLKKEKKRAADAASGRQNIGQSLSSSRGENVAVNGLMHRSASESSDLSMASNGQGRPLSSRKHAKEFEEKAKAKILGDMSVGRQEAFEVFRQDYENNHTIIENKHQLKQRYCEAKRLGEGVNKSRTSINHIKGQIEQHRMQMVMQGLADPNNPQPDELEQELREQIEMEKSRYKESFNHLRSLKAEIEHLQHLLEKAKVQLMKDFELWWAQQASAAQEPPAAVQGNVRSAWRTPPITPLKHQHNKHGSADMVSPSNSDMSLSKMSTASRMRQSMSRDPGGLGYQPTPPQQNGHRSRSSQESSSGIPLTGDPKADADIMAFVRARQNLIKQTQQQPR